MDPEQQQVPIIPIDPYDPAWIDQWGEMFAEAQRKEDERREGKVKK